jgi:hypothetical protein
MTQEAIMRILWIAGIALAFAPDAGRAAGANGYTDIEVFDQGWTVQQQSTKKKGNWEVQTATAQAASRYSAVDTASVSSSGSGLSDVANANLWGGDVLTFDVAGADKKTVTVIGFTTTAHGSSSENAVAALAYCFGAVLKPTNCPSFQWGEARDALGLPEPKHVLLDAGYQTSGAQNDSWEIASNDQIQIQGPHAVVPMWFWMTADSSVFGSDAGAGGTLQGMDIILPGGVSCTSRSGLAFNGRCPKAVK